MVDVERQFLGVWIPKEVYLNPNLTAVEKILLTEINYLDNDKHCYATNKYLADFCGVSESSITRSIKKFVELGLVETEMQPNEHGTTRIVKMTKGYSQFEQTGVVNLSRPLSSNCRANNKDLIIKENNKEKIKTPLSPYGEITYFPDTELDSKFKEWLEYRREIKKPYKSDKSIAMLIKQMQDSGLNNDELIECFNKSMANSYQGVFFVKNKKKTTIDWSKV